MAIDMTFDYNEESKSPLTIVLGNGKKIHGEFIDVRIAADTIPEGKQWYHLRHSDCDGGDIASVRRGCVSVNFFGTFICHPVRCLENLGEEREVMDYSFCE